MRRRTIRWKYRLNLRQSIQIIFRRGSIMKTKCAILIIAVVLAGSLLAVAAQAGGVARNQYSEGLRGGTNVATAPSLQQGKPNSSTAKPVGPKLVNHNPAGGKANGSSSENSNKFRQGSQDNPAGETKLACKQNADHAPAADSRANCGGLNCERGLTIDYLGGAVCWGHGVSAYPWSDCLSNKWCAPWRPDCTCCQSWYDTGCYAVCGGYHVCDEPSGCSLTPDVSPILGPTVKTVRIVNPAETQTTFGFTIDGKTYSLEAGKTQEVELAGNIVIRFDRKP
jgi:hypothetical protein